MAIQKNTPPYDTSEVDYLFDPYQLAGGEQHLRINANDLLDGQRWGFVFDPVSNHYGASLAFPAEQMVAGLQEWHDPVTGDGHVIVRDETQAIIGSIVFEGWVAAWPVANNVTNFEQIKNNDLNKFTLITKDVSVEDALWLYPYTDVSMIPGPENDGNDEYNRFYLSYPSSTTSIDPVTYEPTFVNESITITGSAFRDIFSTGANPTTFISSANNSGLLHDSLDYSGQPEGIIVDFNTFRIWKKAYEHEDNFSEVVVANIIGSNTDDVFKGPTTSQTPFKAIGNAGDDWFYNISFGGILQTGLGADYVDASTALPFDESPVLDVILQIDGTWSVGYQAVNVGGESTVGTGQSINIDGYAQVEDTIHGSANAQINLEIEYQDEFNLSGKGIVLALDDQFSKQHSQVTDSDRLTFLSKITATVADDIVDLTSTKFSTGQKALTIDALNGDDAIWGSDGDEIIYGGEGDDTLFGGAGTNSLTGGIGADAFQFTTTSVSDTILDFNLAEGDRLEFFNTEGAVFNKDTLALNHPTGDELTIQYSDTQSLTIILSQNENLIGDLSSAVFII